MQHWRIHATALLLFIAFLPPARAEPGAALEQELLRATRYAATIRASFGPNCRNKTPLAQSPKYAAICAKLNKVPDAVIELAVRPYVQNYVSREVALQAIVFWSSSNGQALSQKIIREIETGHFDQLSRDDLKALDQANKTSYGRALKAFASDKDVNAAVVRSMLAYEP